MASVPRRILFLLNLHRSDSEDRALMSFDPADPRYNCCFRSMTAKRGALCIGYGHILAAVAAFVLGCILAQNMYILSVTVPMAIIVAFFGSLLVFGVHAEAPQLLLPFLILQSILVVGGSACFVYESVHLCIVGQKAQQNAHGNMTEVGLAVMGVVLTGFGLGLELWFYFIVLTAFRFLRDKRRARSVGIDQQTLEQQQRDIRNEFGLPPPPPRYSENPPPQTLNPGRLAVEYPPPNPCDGPPGYEESCSTHSTSISSFEQLKSDDGEYYSQIADRNSRFVPSSTSSSRSSVLNT